MLLHLIKKDFLIAKKYLLIMLLISVFIPIFVIWYVPELGAEIGFVLSVIFTVFMILQQVSIKEYQYPKVSALLCSAPYPRKFLVLSKYGFCIGIYFLCSLIYLIEITLFPMYGKLSINLVLGMFLILSVFIGVFLPIQFKYGYAKTKFIFMIVIMTSPILFPQLIKLDKGLSLNIVNTISPVFLYVIVALISISILMISALISIKIFEDKDLA
jgi:ABC-2 type transport system permease protein